MLIFEIYEYKKLINVKQPVYALTKGLDLKTVRKAVGEAFAVEKLDMEYMPESIRNEYDLVDLNTALKYIQYIGPILVIVLGILDFIKAVASGSSETFNGAWKKLLKRLIIAVLLFFIVVLLKFVFRIFGILAPTDCFK